jgi:3-deoxy-manno-octulosonate cytidylyltransferase (CMP-KDO synthetase)
MKTAGIIPARYASTRFPGKSLAVIGEKTMIQRVYEQASKAVKLHKVVVATDDSAIFNHVKSFGGEVVMTSPEHLNGTLRVNEAASLLDDNFDVIINIQGDEPFIEPQIIDEIAAAFESGNTDIATMAKKIDNDSDIFNENVVKVVFDKNGKANYFSRAAIPFLRNVEKQKWIKRFDFYKHIGIYGYRREVLDKIVSLEPSGYELAESLEQLRWLDAGYYIKVLKTSYDSVGIDTYDDLRRALQYIETQKDG